MQYKAFTLAEVLITLGIIGIVAAITLPALIQKLDERQNITSLLKFASTISQAVNKYKAETGCTSAFSDCIVGPDSLCSNFEPIAKNLKVIHSVRRRDDLSKANWLPDKAYNYYGELQNGFYGGVSKITIGDCAYALSDGTIFSIDINPSNFDIVVDVNGKKRPNRVGRDIFFFAIGGNANFNGNRLGTILQYDILPYPLGSVQNNAYDGMCTIVKKCNPTNLDPTKENGASPTSYVLLMKKLPPLYRASN